MADLVGRTLSHFHVVERLGEGGMGIVYKATDEALRRTVALKVLPEAMMKDEERRRRFLREARSAAAVTHSNIATVYEVGEVEGRVFLAMEFVEGKSLRKRLEEGGLTIAQALHFARGILRGIAKAHDKGIIHRDLKPDNVLINDEDEVKVLDFGLAKLREADEVRADSVIEQQETASQVTQEGRVLGTPGYMSPEQTKGRGVDHRTDIFSFGVMLYEMLTGSRPFQGETSFDVLVAVSRDEPEPISKRNPAVGQELSAIVSRCLAKAPEQRYANAREVLGALENVSATGDVLPSKATIPAASLPSTQGQVVASGAPPKHTKPRGRWLALLLVIGVMTMGRSIWKLRSMTTSGAHGGGGGGGGGGAAHSAATQESSASEDEDSEGTALTDHPAPKTGNPEAAAAYASGLQHARDASLASAVDDFVRAARLDPALAAAHLRVALYDWGASGTSSLREHVAAAAQFRGSLDERDRALLEFTQLSLADPPDVDAELRRLRAIADRFDDDSEVAFLYANVLHHAGRNDEARKEAERALRLDRQLAAALWVVAEIDQDTDPDAALATLGRCLELSKEAASCLRVRSTIYGDRGQCADLEADARRMTVIEPKGPRAYEFMAVALAARSAPLEGIRLALDNRVPLEPDERSSAKAKIQAALWTALLVGDLGTAEAKVREADKLLENSLSESEHVVVFEFLTDILEERGERAKLLAEADAYERRASAWAHDSPLALLRIAYLRRHAGLLDAGALARIRGERLSMLTKISPNLPSDLRWIVEYGLFAATAEEANEALAAKPDAAMHQSQHGLTGFFPGRLYLLAGQAAAAIPLLRQAAGSCWVLDTEESTFVDTILYMRSHLLLGQALEQTGDKPGACAAYSVVLDRWKNAKPRSVTLDKARERSKALACGG